MYQLTFSALQVVKGVAIGITQSFQFFGLHTFCPQNIWPQTPVCSILHEIYLVFLSQFNTLASEVKCLRVIERRDLSNERNTFKSKTILSQENKAKARSSALQGRSRKEEGLCTRQLQGRSRKEEGLCTRQLQGRSRKEEGLCTRQLQGRSRKEEGLCTRQLQGRSRKEEGLCTQRRY